MATLGERIRELREARGWRQEDLGEQLNVGKSAISQWESETRAPSYASLMALSELFNTSADFLLGRTDDPTPPGAQPFDPGAPDWREHPGCPDYLKEWADDPDLADLLESPRNRRVVASAFFHGKPSKEMIRRVLIALEVVRAQEADEEHREENGV